MNRLPPRPIIVLAFLLLAPLLSAWFHVLSEDAYFAANPHVRYAEVRKEPEKFRGTTLLLAGQIVERADAEGTRLDILCYERDEEDRPVAPDPGCGRLWLIAPQRLDGELFAAGRLVTFAATVTGEREGEIPLFALLEIYSWRDPDREPLYPPYVYPPWWCDPWWPDPFCAPYYPYGRWYGGFGWHW